LCCCQNVFCGERKRRGEGGVGGGGGSLTESHGRQGNKEPVERCKQSHAGFLAFRSVKDSDNHLNDHDKAHVVGASLKEVRELLIEVQQGGEWRWGRQRNITTATKEGYK